MVSDPELILRLYRSLLRIRRVEEEVARIYPTDKIKSPVHLSIGQESVAVGVCDPLKPEDVLFGTYRDHATYLAKGGNLRRMIAELYGKATGCAKGKGGSMHLIDLSVGAMGASAIVGTTIPHAVGYAYAVRLERRGIAVVSLFGDGAVDEGAFHESLNFAALKKLPVLFVCENNHYAIHSHHLSRHAGDNLCERAGSYGMPAERLDDRDPVALRTRVAERVAELRAGRGPFFMEVRTYRWKEHVGPNDDFACGYRAPEEARPWIESDPLARLGSGIPPERRSAIDREVESEIRDAFEYAENSPFPEISELHTDLYGE